jgi:hypothetical protein
LLKWYEENISICIKKEFDWTIERLDRLQELDDLNVRYYWEHRQDMFTNPNQYPFPPYSLEKFGELDFVISEPFSDEETYIWEEKVNVRGLGEEKVNVKDFRKWSHFNVEILGFDIM